MTTNRFGINFFFCNGAKVGAVREPPLPPLPKTAPPTPRAGWGGEGFSGGRERILQTIYRGQSARISVICVLFLCFLV